VANKRIPSGTFWLRAVRTPCPFWLSRAGPFARLSYRVSRRALKHYFWAWSFASTSLWARESWNITQRSQASRTAVRSSIRNGFPPRSRRQPSPWRMTSAPIAGSIDCSSTSMPRVKARPLRCARAYYGKCLGLSTISQTANTHPPLRIVSIWALKNSPELPYVSGKSVTTTRKLMSQPEFRQGLSDAAMRQILQQLDKDGFRELPWIDEQQVLPPGQFCRRRLKASPFSMNPSQWEIRWCSLTSERSQPAESSVAPPGPAQLLC